MSELLVVDWLGRGGIAQTSRAWLLVDRDHGHRPRLVTRSGTELADTPGADVVGVAPRRGRLATQAALVDAVVRQIRLEPPTAVVVQNYLVPPLEERVWSAADRAGVPVHLVVHNHRPHSRSAGLRVGLSRLLRRSASVVCHSEFVAEQLPSATEATVVPHPVQLGLVPDTLPEAVERAPRRAGTYGTLSRGYKGSDLLEGLAAVGTPNWCLVAFGPGAPTGGGAVESHPGYLPDDRFVELVASCDAAVLPYHAATQSGAVVLAQALGAVVVTTRVGGLPEQVEDGRTGLLLEPSAGPGTWADALRRLDDGDLRRRLREAAWQSVWSGHERFAAHVRWVADGGAGGPTVR